MIGLSASELVGMREAIGQLLPDVCSRLTVINTPDGFGGVTQTWATAATNIPCRLDVKQEREITQAGAIQQFTGYMLSLPYDTTVNAADRILLNGVTYAVTGINKNQSWIAVRRVMLEMV